VSKKEKKKNIKRKIKRWIICEPFVFFIKIIKHKVREAEKKKKKKRERNRQFENLLFYSLRKFNVLQINPHVLIISLKGYLTYLFIHMY
jgi:hypothetical protein